MLNEDGTVVLIETLWNVKFFLTLFFARGFSVLIETLWNVKDGAKKYDCWLAAVLIETLWNVKILAIIRETISEMY